MFFKRPYSDKQSGVFLVIFIIVFAWIMLGNLLEKQITKENLRHIKAPVTKIQIETYDCRGRSRFSVSTCERTRIAVKGETGYFKIVDYHRNYTSMAWLQPGDTIDLYVRHWYQYFFTLGRYKAIYILEKDNEVYYTFEDYQTGFLLVLLGGIGLVISLILFYVWKMTPRWYAAGKLN